MAHALAKQRPLNWWPLLSSVALIIVWLFFLAANVSEWRATGRPVGLGFMAMEALTIVLFVVRRRPRETSRSLLAWLATGMGTFGVLATRPAYSPIGGLDPLYAGMQLVGVAAAVVSLWSLGRSFGLVAANRGVQIEGPYRLVRHPIYAGYLMTNLAYLLENPSLYNAAIFSVVWAFQLTRIAKEEEFLSTDPAYTAYRERVRYRLAPFLY